MDTYTGELEVTLTLDVVDEDFVVEAMLERDFELDTRREVSEGIELTFLLENFEYEGDLEEIEDYCSQDLLGTGITDLASEIDVNVDGLA
jgi:hypothetical protein